LYIHIHCVGSLKELLYANEVKGQTGPKICDKHNLLWAVVHIFQCCEECNGGPQTDDFIELSICSLTWQEFIGFMPIYEAL